MNSVTRQIAFLLLFLSLFTLQNAQYSSYSASYTDTQRDGHVVSTELTWSTDSMAKWMQTHNKTKVPMLVFSHGFLSQGSWFKYLAKILSDEGYVFATLMDYQNVDIGDPFQYGLDLAFLLQEIPKDTNCPISGKIDQNSAAVGGHSEGGAGSYVAANPNNYADYHYKGTYKAAVTLSGCFVGDLGFLEECVRRDNISFLVIAGTLDCLCTDDVESSLYKMMPSKCKYYVDFVNASHCYFADAPSFFDDLCLLAEELNGLCHVGHTLLSPSAQQALVMRYALSFLKWTLANDANGKAEFDKIIVQDSGKVKSENSCSME